ncbi:MAG TPA: peptidylprolyl isomerase [Bacteroidales bacterium]|nr:peptidylprolyl isomerase [Bacteroidales bacterium]
MHYFIKISLLIGFVLLVSCQSKLENKEQQKAKNAEVISNEVKPDFIRLTNENIIDELTIFGIENPETEVLIETSLGNISIKLYAETPLHRANFVRLIKLGYFDETVFYRVIAGFVAQGGNSRNPTHAAKRLEYGDYTVPPEFNAKFVHKKGALAMARGYTNNRKKRSAAYDFYLVQGELNAPNGTNYTEDQKATYQNSGGVPYLDNEHTVFGEITNGFDVLDKICAVPVDNANWPLTEISIKIKLLSI